MWILLLCWKKDGGWGLGFNPTTPIPCHWPLFWVGHNVFQHFFCTPVVVQLVISAFCFWILQWSSMLQTVVALWRNRAIVFDLLVVGFWLPAFLVPYKRFPLRNDNFFIISSNFDCRFSSYVTYLAVKPPEGKTLTSWNQMLSVFLLHL
jgi:hypothetical protein